MSTRLYESFCCPRNLGLLQNDKSCVFKTCSASSGEETTTTGMEPSLRWAMGPCFLESFVRNGGRLPAARNWWRFPMNGRHRGPGGALVFVGFVVLLRRRYRKIMGRTMQRNSDIVDEVVMNVT